MIKLLIFDWDDVITLGGKEGYFACYHAALVAVGVHLSPEEEHTRIMAKWSKPVVEELKELLKEHPERVTKAHEAYKKEKDRIFLKNLRILQGTNKILTQLRKRYTLAVATGNTEQMIRDKIIPHFRIPSVFSYILSSHDVHDVDKTKPHPYMLEFLMQRTNMLPHETVYVGDAATDLTMAQNAGVTPVIVLTGHLSKKEAQDLGATWIIADITHLPDALSKIENGNAP